MEQHLGLMPDSGCLVCRSPLGEPFLDLGRTGLANNLPEAGSAADSEPLYPLRVAFCERCRHVQLLDRVRPEEMYAHYLYVSSASSTLSEHLRSLAQRAHSRAGLSASRLAVDIGSNDGSLLSAIASHGARTLGIDPARNLAELARARGVETETAYFGEATAQRVAARTGQANLITATNSFPHIPDLDDYLRGIVHLLAPGGMFVIEAHYLGDLIVQNAFDTIYHEHVSYWALAPLEHLLARHGLAVFDVERLPVHHGQLRAWIGRTGDHAVSPAVASLRLEETAAGLGRRETFAAFAARATALRNALWEEVDRLNRSGATVAGYGAPAKASTLLAWCGFTPRDIRFIADRNALKQGRLTPGTRIPITGPERIAAERPDVLILFAWNFAAEIMTQLGEFGRLGGRFLIPIPQVCTIRP